MAFTPFEADVKLFRATKLLNIKFRATDSQFRVLNSDVLASQRRGRNMAASDGGAIMLLSEFDYTSVNSAAFLPCV